VWFAWSQLADQRNALIESISSRFDGSFQTLVRSDRDHLLRIAVTGLASAAGHRVILVLPREAAVIGTSQNLGVLRISAASESVHAVLRAHCAPRNFELQQFPVDLIHSVVMRGLDLA